MRRNEKIVLSILAVSILTMGLINIVYSESGITPIYPTNENGQTYGIDNDTGKSPDLIAAIGENEVEGYVKQEDLLTEGDFINTLDEALDYDKKRAALAEQGKYEAVPLYESDGETVIGEFRIYY